MRTTLDLDMDVLLIIKHLAAERKQSLGRVLSDTVRQGLQPQHQVEVRVGDIPVLPRKSGAKPVTSQIVKELMNLDG